MRRKDKEVTDQQVIDDILKNSEICRIALFDENFPYLVPLNYGYFNNSLYFHSIASGKKIALIEQNNKVCFEIENYNEIIKDEISCNWTTKYRSIIGYGTIEIIQDFEEKKKGLDIIMEHNGKKENNVYKNIHVKNIVILKLKIQTLTAKQSGDW